MAKREFAGSGNIVSPREGSSVKAAPVRRDLGAPTDSPVPPPRIKKPGSEALGAAFMGTT